MCRLGNTGFPQNQGHRSEKRQGKRYFQKPTLPCVIGSSLDKRSIQRKSEPPLTICSNLDFIAPLRSQLDREKRAVGSSEGDAQASRNSEDLHSRVFGEYLGGVVVAEHSSASQKEATRPGEPTESKLIIAPEIQTGAKPLADSRPGNLTKLAR